MISLGRMLWIDLITIVVASGVVLLRHISKQPWPLLGIAVLVVGFSFGAHTGVVAVQRTFLRIAIIGGSVLFWLICVYALMLYSLNTFGS